MTVDSYTSMWLRYLPPALEKCGAKILWHRRLMPDDVQSWKEHLLDNGPVDVNFTVRDDVHRYQDNPGRLMRHHARNYTIGWAADVKLFYPERVSNGILRIFVDHVNFDCKLDYSLTLLMNIAAGQKEIKTQGYTDIQIRTLADTGLVDVDLTNIQIRPFRRTHLPVERFAAVLRKSDIFIVTHQESLGLTTLEASKCGVRVLCPEGTIAQVRLERLEHRILSLPAEWAQKLSGLDKMKCASCVSDETWEAVSSRIIKGFRLWSSLLPC